LRVLVVCDWFLKYAARQTEALARAGVEVRLACRGHSREFGDSGAERARLLAELNAVPVHVVPGRVTSPFAVHGVLAIRRAVSAWAPDLVHAHDNADPRLLAIVAGTPRVTTVHDPVPHPGQPVLGRVESAIRRRWIAGSAAVVVHGVSLTAELPAWARKRRVEVVPHGASVLDEPLPIPPRPSVLLFGRLEPYKGIDVLIRSMERVWTSRPEVVLRIAGTGSSSSTVPDDPRIELRPEYVPEAELSKLFEQATLAVLPYTQASQSGVAGVALGHGIPTVVSDVGALREVVLDESFVVPAGDDEALANAILRHLEHDDAVRRSVLDFARTYLSWDACARRTLDVYDSVLGRERT
jgi:glycosyltransferase involved in cell wall biosynthesis